MRKIFLTYVNFSIAINRQQTFLLQSCLLIAAVRAVQKGGPVGTFYLGTWAQGPHETLNKIFFIVTNKATE